VILVNGEAGTFKPTLVPDFEIARIKRVKYWEPRSQRFEGGNLQMIGQVD